MRYTTEIASSTLLGNPGFIALLKEKYLAGKKTDKEIPTLKELHQKVSSQEFFVLVDTVFGNEPALSRNVKLYRSWKYTGERLKEYRRVQFFFKHSAE